MNKKHPESQMARKQSHKGQPESQGIAPMPEITELVTEDESRNTAEHDPPRAKFSSSGKKEGSEYY